ncbi:hypothetical protein ACSTKK_00160, partial [Vibrio parahaemolyticus]
AQLFSSEEIAQDPAKKIVSTFLRAGFQESCCHYPTNGAAVAMKSAFDLDLAQVILRSAASKHNW